ncbi:hypothetical protein GCM10010869_29000 [Mesorhizobium tianshanense]|uniref:hypothetical protein n=1 Tax=Mesorhizobium tianshanense TaxID=39844 RepID=UPI0012DD66FD|nr:hypothetical protein [Mesorhizobium tianshanense]GLS37307.1 hypothetical protein GCM10010869_29000 [Mesorhizobium tianshanense]
MDLIERPKAIFVSLSNILRVGLGEGIAGIGTAAQRGDLLLEGADRGGDQLIFSFPSFSVVSDPFGIRDPACISGHDKNRAEYGGNNHRTSLVADTQPRP